MLSFQCYLKRNASTSSLEDHAVLSSQSTVSVNYGDLGQQLGLTELQVRQIFQKAVEVLEKLSIRGQSSRLNLLIGSLHTSENRVLKFVETLKPGHDQTTMISQGELKSCASQPSLSMTSQQELSELERRSKHVLEENLLSPHHGVNDFSKSKEMKLTGIVHKPRRSIFEASSTSKHEQSLNSTSRSAFKLREVQETTQSQASLNKFGKRFYI